MLYYSRLSNESLIIIHTEFVIHIFMYIYIYICIYVLIYIYICFTDKYTADVAYECWFVAIHSNMSLIMMIYRMC